MPFGSLAKDVAMSDAVTGQLSFMVDAGSKVSPGIFLGGFLGVGVGGPAGEHKQRCDLVGARCLAVTARLGGEVLFGFIPDGKVNPWIGFGVGFELTQNDGSNNGRRVTDSVSGFEFAHFMGGADFRINQKFGLGPFVDFSLGQYSTQTIEFDGIQIDGSIRNKAMHEWLTLGVRGVIWP